MPHGCMTEASGLSSHIIGMSATLPAGWESAWDSNHSRAYYYNASLGLTQWEPPPAAVVTRCVSMDQPHAHAGLAAAHTQPHVLSAQPDSQPHNHSAKTDTSQADAGTALPQPITVATQAGQAEAQADWYYRDPVGQVQVRDTSLPCASHCRAVPPSGPQCCTRAAMEHRATTPAAKYDNTMLAAEISRSHACSGVLLLH
ncbi:WW domain-containing protein [Haematococcus lacustris]|uniref:WW domain-containing protein n=1 Tax=Haematococcus lacustris TaxID=44745 RepID=A0A699YCP7_HAELA|nr:WW domain-containing protein [Haematococcus lacustris]